MSKSTIHKLTDFTGSDMDLSILAIQEARYAFIQKYKVYPVTLIVGLYLVDKAYEIILEMGSNQMIIVPVPGLPREMWAVCGSNGIIISEGC